MQLITRNYEIGTGQPGAPAFALTLTFGPDNEVSGRGIVTQAIDPPLRLQTWLFGSDLRNWEIGIGQIVRLTGYSVAPVEPMGFINVECTLVFRERGAADGLAQLSLRDSATARWTVLENLPIRSIERVAA